MAKEKATRTNDFGIKEETWVSYTETKKEEYNRTYNLLLKKKYEVVKEFTDGAKENIEQHYDQLCKLVTKIIVRD